jgi:hypothetical protein
MKSTRLEFVQGALGVGVTGLLTAACGGDDDDNNNNNGGDTCGTTIGTNHGHKMTVTRAEAMAGQAKTYHIKGDSPHDHTVELSAEDFADLLDGTTMIVTSSTDESHAHDVTIECV